MITLEQVMEYVSLDLQLRQSHPAIRVVKKIERIKAFGRVRDIYSIKCDRCGQYATLDVEPPPGARQVEGELCNSQCFRWCPDCHAYARETCYFFEGHKLYEASCGYQTTYFDDESELVDLREKTRCSNKSKMEGGDTDG